MVLGGVGLVRGVGRVVVGDAQHRAEHQADRVDRLHERDRVALVQQCLRVRGVDGAGHRLDRRHPAGDEFLAHQALVLRFLLVVVGIRNGEQAAQEFVVVRAGDQRPQFAHQAHQQVAFLGVEIDPPSTVDRFDRGDEPTT